MKWRPLACNCTWHGWDHRWWVIHYNKAFCRMLMFY